MCKNILLAIVLLLTVSAGAQVSVASDGSAAHASAALDIKSIDKGLLIPRMSTAQRNAIPTPEKGLLVYDQSTSSFWYFDGISWREKLDDANSIWNESVAGQLTNRRGSTLGLNITTPRNTLHLNDVAPVLHFSNTITGTTNTDGAFIGMRQTFLPGKFFIWNNENSPIRFKNYLDEPLLTITETGNAGIGNFSPSSPLSFGSGAGDKINFFDISPTQSYGIGISPASPFGLQFHTPGSLGRFQFGHGETGAGFTETMSVDGVGDVRLSNKLTRQSVTGNANILPVAFGSTNVDGSIVNSSGSILVTRLSVGLYEITLAGSDMSTNPDKYVILVTPKHYPGLGNPYYKIGIASGKIQVTFERFSISIETTCTVCGGESVGKVTNATYVRADCGFSFWVYRAE